MCKREWHVGKLQLFSTFQHTFRIIYAFLFLRRSLYRNLPEHFLVLSNARNIFSAERRKDRREWERKARTNNNIYILSVNDNNNKCKRRVWRWLRRELWIVFGCTELNSARRAWGEWRVNWIVDWESSIGRKAIRFWRRFLCPNAISRKLFFPIPSTCMHMKFNFWIKNGNSTKYLWSTYAEIHKLIEIVFSSPALPLSIVC